MITKLINVFANKKKYKVDYLDRWLIPYFLGSYNKTILKGIFCELLPLDVFDFWWENGQ